MDSEPNPVRAPRGPAEMAAAAAGDEAEFRADRGAPWPGRKEGSMRGEPAEEWRWLLLLRAEVVVFAGLEVTTAAEEEEEEAAVVVVAVAVRCSDADRYSAAGLEAPEPGESSGGEPGSDMERAVTFVVVFALFVVCLSSLVRVGNFWSVLEPPRGTVLV